MNEINSTDFLKQLKDKGIRMKDVGWNPEKHKIGYCKSTMIRGGWSLNFQYFYLEENNVITECPRGFTKLRGYKISDIDNLIQLIGD